MAKIIKLTPEYIEEVKKAFEESLRTTKVSDGKVSFTKTFGNINRKATVFFTELAWLKMQTLIREFSTEVAWHGIATRGADADKDEYYITDILVYPQEVGSATVNTDQEKYQTWLMEHDDDVFNTIRMQGHSHVNMGVTPSTVDTSLYDRILEQLEDDMFYIFMIWNKRGEKTVKIYDLAKNTLFETADCTVKIVDDGTGIEKFLRESKEMVKDKAVTTKASTAKGYNEFGGCLTAYSGQSGHSSYGTTSSKKEEKKEEKKEDKSDKSPDKKSGKRKGRRKNNMKNASDIKPLTVFDDYGADDEYDYDPYSAFGYRDEFYR